MRIAKTPGQLASRRRVTIALVFLSLCYVLTYISIQSNNLVQTYVMCDHESCNSNILRFNQVHWQNKTQKKILLWTQYFSTFSWQKRIETVLKRCKCNCSVTIDRNEIESADAVIFHYLDLWFWEKSPNYRNVNQVWVVYNEEPTPFVHHTGLFSWKNKFNWTMSYRQDSTIYSPYGAFLPLSSTNKAKMTKEYANRSFASEKSKMVAAIFSDCADEAKRHELIQELSNYVQLDFYGDCGNLTCPYTIENIKSCKNRKYRYRIAFENSNCRDYVTEKFFDALELDSIPIVNWKHGQGVPSAPNKSYINIYDFKSTKQLAEYLIFLSKNEDKYNEYFKWKTNYTFFCDNWRTFQTLCEELHKPRPAQVVEDASKWMSNDVCQSWSVSLYLYLAFPF